ncbi:MAG TPA: MraY family glycosyltransferase [Acidobacteriota bacterium]|nr:MraY family glycosyltransferase [Acidobacteriota bacterium]
MMDWFELAKLGFAFLLAGVLSYYLTPVVRAAAIRFGIVDRPDGQLKQHEQPVAYLGGVAVFLALLLSTSLAYDFDRTILGIMLGTTIIIILGLVDDFGVLSPSVKIGGQLVALWLLIKAGISVKLVWLPEPVNWLITLLWVIGVTNAFNLIDIMDGLASGIALIACVFLAIVSFLNGNYLIAAFTVALAGSLIGFLPYNLRPASIYLGDTGSMAIGFVLAALTINERYTVINERIGILAPVVILGIPIFETAFLVIVRSLKRIPVLRGSPDHFAIRLRRLGWGIRRIVITVYAAGFLLGLLGLVVVYTPGVVAATVVALTAVVALAFGLFLYIREPRLRGTRGLHRNGEESGGAN